jgi:hypothetical protein
LSDEKIKKARPDPEEHDGKQIRQLNWRIHIDDLRIVKQLLADDELMFKSFADCCIHAYMRGDPLMLKMIKMWKELNLVDGQRKDLYTLSQRERSELLKQLEDMEEKDKHKKEKDDKAWDLSPENSSGTR